MLQAVRLVPARGEDVEGDLASDGEAVGSMCVSTPSFFFFFFGLLVNGVGHT